MLMKIFVALIIIVAIAIGLGARLLPHELLINNVVYFREFFDATLPILAFGALIKYLCTCCIKCEVCHDRKCDDKKSPTI